jgi:hypothetical protein
MEESFDSLFPTVRLTCRNLQPTSECALAARASLLVCTASMQVGTWGRLVVVAWANQNGMAVPRTSTIGQAVLKYRFCKGQL